MKTTFLSLIFAGLLGSAGAADYLSYATTGHAKAQGMNITLDHPAGWTSRDNPQSGVVREFRDPVTSGRDALLVVIPTVQARKATTKEFRKSFELDEAQERIMPGARHKRKAFVDDLDFPCVSLDYDLEIPQFAPAVVQVRNYILLIGDKMVQVQFYGVAPPAEDIRVARESMMQHIVRSIKKL